MPRTSKTTTRTKTTRARTSRRRKSKSLFGELGAIALGRKLKFNRTRGLVAAGFLAVVGVAVVVASHASSTFSFWANSDVPSTKAVSDTRPTELGLRFHTDTNGTITAIRFYKAKANTGQHTGTLWSTTGQSLATVTFANETTSGWQTASLAQPVSVTADTTYVVSYHTNVGRYSVNRKYFTKARDTSPLHAPVSTAASPNGVYAHGASAFPTSGDRASNYWVDVVFAPMSTPSPTPTPTPSATPSSTPSPTPTPPVSGTTTCPLPAYPSPSCTGVPAGTHLTDVKVNSEGDYVVSQNNTVINGLHIPGYLHITPGVTGVVIKNSLIDVGITNVETNSSGKEVYSGDFTVMDTTIGPSSGCLLNMGVGFANYTATRVLIHNLSTGFQVAGPGNVAVNDSFAKMCGLGPTEPANDGQTAGNDGTHSTGLQACSADNTCHNVVIDHVTFDDRNQWHSTSVEIGMHTGVTVGFTMFNSLLVGGTYPINTNWQQDPYASTPVSSNFAVAGNSVANNTWDYAPASAEGTCSHQEWTQNRIVNIDVNYNVTGTVSTLNCIQ